MYGSEKQTAKMVTAFSILAILLACLGLFGIATYTITQRAKEIGIRKVLGASVSNIVLMLSKNFLLLVLIGLIIAAPLSWYLMNNWLQDFTYRIDIKWWMFALPGILAISVAFVTISLQSLRVALANPVESIRTE
jgi:putative ABC transport system permease protein